VYKLFMAFRYLRAHRIVYFSIAGVALGIMTLVVVTSIMGGFSRDMRSRIRGMLTDVVVSSYDKSLWISQYEEICARIAALPHVRGCAPRIEYAAWLGRGSAPRDVVLVGVLPEKERHVGQLEKYFGRGTKTSFDFLDESGREPPHPGLVVGAELPAFGRAGLTTARYGDVPMLLVGDFTVVGSFRSGMTDYDSNYVFMHLADAQRFLKLADPPRVNQLAVAVEDYARHGAEVRRAILDALHEFRPCSNPDSHRFFRCGLFRTQTWEQVRGTLLAAVDVERAIMIIVLFLIVVVAAFNIAAIYTLVVRAKTRDIGILRALGATEQGIVSIFLTSGGLCGVIGSAFGLLLGLLLAHNVNEIQDFVRVVSREMNRVRMEWGGSAWASAALLAAGVALVANWAVLYKERLPHPWARIAAAAVALAGAAWLATAWVPGYRPADAFDPRLGPGSRPALVGGTALAWLLLAAAWRFLDRWRRRPGWIFFGFAATIVFSAFLLAVVAALAVALSVTLLRPEPGWRGLELFSPTIYYLDRIPVHVDHQALVLIVALALVVSVLFSIYPALRAAAADPIEAIRDE
jgi:lipoprotein-releasing system permease protein